MDYGTLKSRIYSHIDEVIKKPGADITKKLPHFVNEGAERIAREYPIWAEKEYGPEDARVLPDDCLEPVTVEEPGQMPRSYSPEDPWPEVFTLKYKKWPAAVSEATGDDVILDTQQEACYALILFTAAQLMSMENNQVYFSNLFSQYQAEMQALAGRAQGIAIVVPPDFVI